MPAAAVAAPRLRPWPPARPTAAIELRDGRRARRARGAQDAARCAGAPAVARGDRRRPPPGRAARPVRGTAGEEVWIGELRRPRQAARCGPGIDRPARRRRRDRGRRRADAERVLEYQTAAGVTRCDGVAAAAVPARLRLRQRALPPRAPSAARARRRDPGGAPGRSGDAGRAAAGRLPLDGGVDDARRGQRRARAGRARRAERRRCRHGLDRGAGRRRPGRVPDRARAPRPATPSRPAHLPRRRLQRPGAPRARTACGGSDRVRAGARAALRRRASRRTPAGRRARWSDAYWVPLPKPIASSCVTVVVTDVAPGSEAAPPKSFGTTAIGELTVFTELDGPERRRPAGRRRRERARLRRRGCRCVGRAGRAGGAAGGAGGAWRTQGSAARVPGRGADDAGAGAQSPIVARGADGGDRRARATRRSGWSTAALRAHAVARAGRGASPACWRRTRRPTTTAPARRACWRAGRRRRGRRRCWRPRHRARRRCAPRWSTRSAARHALRAEARAGRDRRRAARRQPREADLLRAAARGRRAQPERARPRPVGLLRAALAPERPFEVRARARHGAGRAGRRPAIRPRWPTLRASSDEPVLRYLATRELAGPAGGRDARALPCARRWPTPIRACARPRRSRLGKQPRGGRRRRR